MKDLSRRSFLGWCSLWLSGFIAGVTGAKHAFAQRARIREATKVQEWQAYYKEPVTLMNSEWREGFGKPSQTSGHRELGPWEPWSNCPACKDKFGQMYDLGGDLPLKVDIKELNTEFEWKATWGSSV